MPKLLDSPCLGCLECKKIKDAIRVLACRKISMCLLSVQAKPEKKLLKQETRALGISIKNTKVTSNVKDKNIKLRAD